MMVGVNPVSDALGRVNKLEVIPLEELGRPRIDVVVNCSGVFRDLFVNQMNLLDRAIKIDDRDATDVIPYFCSIFVAAPDRLGDALRLTLQHAPSGPEVVELVEELGGEVHPADFGVTITLTLTAAQGPAIRRLAKAVVGRGRSYDDPNLRWICPRTAASLVKLARHLALFRAERGRNQGVKRPDPILSRRPASVVPGPLDKPGPVTRNGSSGGSG